MSNGQKYKHRWIRFSLRTLLVFVTIAGVGFGWLGYKMRQDQQQKMAAEAISNLRAEVRYDYEVVGSGNYHRTIVPASPSGPVWLRKLVGDHAFAKVVYVSWGGGKPTDEAMSHLRALRYLEVLYLHGPEVTDEGIECLQGLTQLKCLWLVSARVTNTGVTHIQESRHLEDLLLECPQMTDAGLNHFRGLLHLENLDLKDTSVTDAGLKHLRELPKLKRLVLMNTRVTEAGCQELQGVRPNLEIIR